MSWIGPYLVPLVIAALVLRRMIKTQKSRPVRFWRLWLIPSILVFIALATLFSSFPGFIALLFMVLAAAAGGALGWFRVHTLQFSTDPETGAVHSKGTPLSAVLFVGLFAARWGLKSVFQDTGLAAATSFVHWTDAGLMFTASLLAAQSAHTWVRARAVLMRPMGESIGPPKQW
jgi:hypothetical protein